MSMQDLVKVKRMLMSELVAEDKKPQDEFRQGIGAGLTMALLKIDRLMESEEEAMVREYEESQDR
jgi:hypothetical protein